MAAAPLEACVATDDVILGTKSRGSFGGSSIALVKLDWLFYLNVLSECASVWDIWEPLSMRI